MMPESGSERLVVKSAGRLRLLRIGEIDWIEAAANYVKLHMGEEAHVVRQTMANLEADLDPRRFIRIHRSRIVNLERIREVGPASSGRYFITLSDGTRIRLSRGGRARLMEVLGNGSAGRGA